MNEINSMINKYQVAFYKVIFICFLSIIILVTKEQLSFQELDRIEIINLSF